MVQKGSIMDSKPDTIHITASHREEISAAHADLFVTVRGSSVVSGNEAMKKAREVSALVDELKKAGVSEENLHLQGVHVETSSGTLLRSSGAIYRLRVRCEKLDHLPELLDIIASQKNSDLEYITWKYAEEEARARALETAIAAAKTKAEGIAASLGVKLLGVYSFNENTYDEEAPAPLRAEASMMKTARAAGSEPSLGMDIQHSKMLQVSVEMEYRVSGF
jgi:uncharacterized protein YggE